MIHFENISYAYPHREIQALTEINLHARAGEAILISGRSGCGKSTLGRLINGLIPSYFAGNLKGKSQIAGLDSQNTPFHAMTSIIGSLFQDPEQQFLSTTVEDELRTALEWRGYSEHKIKSRLEPIIARLGLEHKLDSSLFTLSEGEKQKVSLAAVMALHPKILMLDEPTANLDTQSTQELLNLLTELKQSGMTIVIFDHRLYWLESLVDRVYLMEQGRIAEQCAFNDLESYRQRFGLRSSRKSRPTVPLLNQCQTEQMDGILFEGIDFAYKAEQPLFNSFNGGIPRGRVIALCGANGRGKTTLARLTMGLEKLHAGQIHFNGLPLSAKERLRCSSLVLQNTELQLYMRSVAEELESACESTGSQLDIAAALDEFHLSGLQQRHPQSLSGGERQRLVIACALLKKPDVLILDEPTSGLDGYNMELLGRRVRKEAERGATVALITHDSELIKTSCDDIWMIAER